MGFSFQDFIVDWIDILILKQWRILEKKGTSPLVGARESKRDLLSFDRHSNDTYVRESVIIFRLTARSRSSVGGGGGGGG